MRIYITLLILFSAFISFSQNDSTKVKGEVVDGQIIISKDKKIVLDKQDKLIEKTELKSFKSEPLNLKFEPSNPNLIWPKHQTKISPIAHSQKIKDLNHQNYVKFGFGNYLSTLFGAGFFYELDKHHLGTEFLFEHFTSGPIGGKASENSDIFFKIFDDFKISENLKLVPRIQFKNESYHYYGNTKQVFSDTISVKPANFSNFLTDLNTKFQKNDISVELKPEFSLTSHKNNSENTSSSESIFGLNGKFDYQLTESFKTGLKLNIHASKFKNGWSYNRSLLSLSPTFTYKMDKLSINGNIEIASEKSLKTQKTFIYPNAKLNYQISEKLTTFLGYESGMKWNDYNQLLTKNPFLSDSLDIKTTIQKIGVRAGFSAKMNQKIRLGANFIYENLSDLPLFVNAVDSSQFTIRYDSLLTKTGILANFSIFPTPKTMLSAIFKYNYFKNNSEKKAWHLPKYEANLNISHTIKEKFTVATSWIILAGIDVQNNNKQGYKTLPLIADSNIKLNYKLNENFSFFLTANNLISRKYERFLGYPVRSLAFKIGIMYAFF